MARTKFTFEKRQREIARQQKQKDKAARRAEAKQPVAELDAEPTIADLEAPGGRNDAAPSGEETTRTEQ